METAKVARDYVRQGRWHSKFIIASDGPRIWPTVYMLSLNGILPCDGEYKVENRTPLQ